MDLDLTVSDISLIMGTQNYGVCYEPIKDAMSLKTIGYEALSRFKYKGYFSRCPRCPRSRLSRPTR